MARLILSLILVLTGCTTVVEKPVPPQPPKPAAERAIYTPTTFNALPGWDAARLEPSLRAFLAGCPRAGGPLINACAIASSVPVGDESAARRFFEATFTPYSLTSSESGEIGLITGYYEPILHGSRLR